MAAFPYSCQTGEYTIEQLDGEDCAKCGQRFRVGEKSRPVERIAEWQLFAHVLCPNVAAAMSTITPAQAQRRIDRPLVLTSLAEVHTAWGEAAWSAGNYHGAVRNWQIAAKLYRKAEAEGGAK